VWLKRTPPAAAKVAVLREDFTEPCWAVARWSSYVQQKKDGSVTKMWATMGDLMLAKCAESLALRKAFPQELSGLYTSDEMDQAQEPTQVGEPKPSPLPAGQEAPTEQRSIEDTRAETKAANDQPMAKPVTLEDEAREAARHGRAVFQTLWRRCNKGQQSVLQGISEELRGLMDDFEHAQIVTAEGEGDGR
jgi:hypothetical protein